MIPKTIHYCWVGPKKPPLVEHCLSSWRKILNGFEIREWNESNIEFKHPYIREAYKRKLYAFVADYVRFHVLYEFGGIYLDADMEALRPFTEDILMHSVFFCFANNPAVQSRSRVASAVIGCVPRHPFLDLIAREYRQMNKVQVEFTSPRIITETIERELGHKLFNTNEYVKLPYDGVIFPHRFFMPLTVEELRAEASSKSRSQLSSDYYHREAYTFHHFMWSWRPRPGLLKKVKNVISKLFPREFIKKLPIIGPFTRKIYRNLFP